MTYSTYEFTALSENALVGDGSIAVGTTFTVPSDANARISVSDDESNLGGDLRLNEHADDLHVSGATIEDFNGTHIGNGDKIYGEQYLLVRDQ